MRSTCSTRTCLVGASQPVVEQEQVPIGGDHGHRVLADGWAGRWSQGQRQGPQGGARVPELLRVPQDPLDLLVRVPHTHHKVLPAGHDQGVFVPPVRCGVAVEPVVAVAYQGVHLGDVPRIGHGLSEYRAEVPGVEDSAHGVHLENGGLDVRPVRSVCVDLSLIPHYPTDTGRLEG
jgi:hypothetical protein